MPPPCSCLASYSEPSWSTTATLTASGRRVRTTHLPSPRGWVPSTEYGSCDQPSTMARSWSPLTSAPTPIVGDAGGVVEVGSAAMPTAVDTAGADAAFVARLAGAAFFAVLAGVAFLAAVAFFAAGAAFVAAVFLAVVPAVVVPAAAVLRVAVFFAGAAGVWSGASSVVIVPSPSSRVQSSRGSRRLGDLRQSPEEIRDNEFSGIISQCGRLRAS